MTSDLGPHEQWVDLYVPRDDPTLDYDAVEATLRELIAGVGPELARRHPGCRIELPFIEDGVRYVIEAPTRDDS